VQAAYAQRYRVLWERHWWWRSREALLLATIGRLARSMRVERLLDVGCGDGLFFDALARFGEVAGLEPDAALLDDHRWRDRIAVGRLGPGFRPGRAYDLVMMLDVLEHIEDDRAALESARDLTRTGGVLLLTVPALPWLWSRHDEANDHHRRYRPGGLRDVPGRAGFQVESVRYFFAWTVAPMLLRRWLAPAGRGCADYDVAIPPSAINRALTAYSRAEHAVGRLIPWPIGQLAPGDRPTPPPDYREGARPLMRSDEPHPIPAPHARPDSGPTARPALSVVVPVFEEEAVVPVLVERLARTLDGLGVSVEVILVDDGSNDGTWAEVARGARGRPEVRRAPALEELRPSGRHLGGPGRVERRGGRRDGRRPPGPSRGDPRPLDPVSGRVRRRLCHPGEPAGRPIQAAGVFGLLPAPRPGGVDPDPKDAGDFGLISRRVVDLVVAMPRAASVCTRAPGLGRVPPGRGADRPWGEALGDGPSFTLRKLLGLAIDGLVGSARGRSATVRHGRGDRHRAWRWLGRGGSSGRSGRAWWIV